MSDFNRRLKLLRDCWLGALEVDATKCQDSGMRPSYEIGDQAIDWDRHRLGLVCCVALATALLSEPQARDAYRLVLAVLAGEGAAGGPLGDLVREEVLRE
jgi:hypothetical protein